MGEITVTILAVIAVILVAFTAFVLAMLFVTLLFELTTVIMDYILSWLPWY